VTVARAGREAFIRLLFRRRRSRLPEFQVEGPRASGYYTGPRARLLLVTVSSRTFSDGASRVCHHRDVQARGLNLARPTGKGPDSVIPPRLGISESAQLGKIERLEE
jgi:hypothetical protein